jgi:hypothetical protein
MWELETGGRNDERLAASRLGIPDPIKSGLICGLVAAFVFSPSFGQAQAIAFPDFSSTSGIRLVGSARHVGKVMRLTPARTNRAGAAWYTERLRVGDGFESTFQFQLTRQGGLGNGADGLAFVLQDTGTSAVGGPGAAGGFALGSYEFASRPGIPRSIAVFFDTFQNTDVGDPSDNFVVVATNGSTPEMKWPPPRLGLVPRLDVTLKDGRIHTARILYRPPVISVFLDDLTTPVLTSSIDLASVVDPATGTAYVGLTASTGAGWENHDILSWSFQNEAVSSNIGFSREEVSSSIRFYEGACLPNRNLCTPDHATVEARGPGQYHIVLPAHLEWGASIPNATGVEVAFGNSFGSVCWDLKGRGAAGCNGPRGNGTRGGPGFLAPAEAAGALIFKTTGGRTYFSVNDRSGGAFQNHEGYFEFDVTAGER